MQHVATMTRALIPAMQPDIRPGENVNVVELARGDLEILSHLADGETLHEISRNLHMSHRTVCRRVADICEGIGVGRPIQAVAWAARRRLI